jgi:hypothetical protein
LDLREVHKVGVVPLLYNNSFRLRDNDTPEGGRDAAAIKILNNAEEGAAAIKYLTTA